MSSKKISAMVPLDPDTEIIISDLFWPSKFRQASYTVNNVGNYPVIIRVYYGPEDTSQSLLPDTTEYEDDNVWIKSGKEYFIPVNHIVNIIVTIVSTRIKLTAVIPPYGGIGYDPYNIGSFGGTSGWVDVWLTHSM